ncbi:hypothetical protein N5P21_23165 [Pseudomonas citronellolis]|nr:hypothetical protein N5P21_23165 [Pseudomonas citronellolis]
MVTKTGNIFPGHADSDYATALACALRNELGSSHRAVKTLRLWTNASERTAKHWLAGTHGPSGHHLIALVQHSDLVMQTFLSLAQRRADIAASALPSIREKMMQVIELIDACQPEHEGKS